MKESRASMKLEIAAFEKKNAPILDRILRSYAPITVALSDCLDRKKVMAERVSVEICDRKAHNYWISVRSFSSDTPKATPAAWSIGNLPSWFRYPRHSLSLRGIATPSLSRG